MTCFVFQKHWEHYQQHLFSRLSPKLPNNSPTHVSAVSSYIPNIFLCGGLQPEASQFKQQCCAAGSQGEGRSQDPGQPKACRPQVPSQGGKYDIVGHMLFLEHQLCNPAFAQRFYKPCWNRVAFQMFWLAPKYLVTSTHTRFVWGACHKPPHKDCLGILREGTSWGNDSEMLKACSVFKKH